MDHDSHDPNTPPQARNAVRLEDLGEFIRAKRKRGGLTLEEAARQCGISPATLWRLEQQRPGNEAEGRTFPAPDTRTIAAVTRWLDVSLDRVLDATPAGGRPGHGLATPDVVEAHLRADRNLDPEAAASLGRIFRVAYQQFSGSASGGAPESVSKDETE